MDEAVFKNCVGIVRGQQIFSRKVLADNMVGLIGVLTESMAGLMEMLTESMVGLIEMFTQITRRV